jgi:hypothetical protein
MLQKTVTGRSDALFFSWQNIVLEIIKSFGKSIKQKNTKKK